LSLGTACLISIGSFALYLKSRRSSRKRRHDDDSDDEEVDRPRRRRGGHTKQHSPKGELAETAGSNKGDFAMVTDELENASVKYRNVRRSHARELKPAESLTNSSCF
jgi:hypothetical protein